ncbi:MAG: sugar phosphate nucleotidyltransferase [bacterium]|nr:sugar phosphate nucleotidyltransferase [bacterium]
MKAVILAGGGGTRLWPLSTLEQPKQFQKLVSEETMIQQTINRIDFLDHKDIYLAINEKHLDLAKKLCPQIPEENILIEPALRDTASCIGYAAATIEERNPGEVMAIIYADHLIKNKKEFQEKLKVAEKLAQEGFLNIVEVEAKEPNTNYGYVKLGKEIDTDIFELDSFKEKPDHETAKKFIEDGNYLWNTGIYVWKASTILEKFKEHQPETHEILKSIAESHTTERYKDLEKISIDYAIMEKVDPKEVRIIKADLGWSDIGNFEALFEEMSNSPEKNITRGNVKLLNCKGCLVYADNDKEIKAIGLENTIIVDTPDGLLVSDKHQSKRIKEIDK